jgi:hypothetical protein
MLEINRILNNQKQRETKIGQTWSVLPMDDEGTRIVRIKNDWKVTETSQETVTSWRNKKVYAFPWYPVDFLEKWANLFGTEIIWRNVNLYRRGFIFLFLKFVFYWNLRYFVNFKNWKLKPLQYTSDYGKANLPQSPSGKSLSIRKFLTCPHCKISKKYFNAKHANHSLKDAKNKFCEYSCKFRV